MPKDLANFKLNSGLSFQNLTRNKLSNNCKGCFGFLSKTLLSEALNLAARNHYKSLAPHVKNTNVDEVKIAADASIPNIYWFDHYWRDQ